MSDSDNETDNGNEPSPEEVEEDRIESERANQIGMKRRYHESKITRKLGQMTYQMDQLCANMSKFEFGIKVLQEINTENAPDIQNHIKNRVIELKKMYDDSSRSFNNRATNIQLLNQMKKEIYDDSDED